MDEDNKKKQFVIISAIYIHIPFCKSRCAYCDFFSTTLLTERKRYIDAVIREWQLRKDYLPSDSPIRTIYFGGGTPSLLSAEDLARCLQALPVEKVQEITIEANPSDITPELLQGWRDAGVNRLSIGVQSLQDSILGFIGRRHNADTARQAVRQAQDAGFENISIDLMYALPQQTLEQWQADIEEVIRWKVKHISAYCLSIEESTRMYERLKEGVITETEDDFANLQYDYLCERLADAGYIHYEVSNFAIQGYESKHNSSYWDGTAYIGLGAGAHSYDGCRTRQWNISNLHAYMSAIEAGRLPFESETLTERDKLNEEVMLALRTRQGLAATEERLQTAKPLIEKGWLINENGHLRATQQGLHILNKIIETFWK